MTPDLRIRTTSTMWTLALLALVAAAIGASCAVEPTSPARSASATRAPNPTQRPPIDELAPAHLETATFALG